MVDTNRIWSDGAELGDVLFWDTPSSFTAVTAQKRSGSYSYLANGTAKKNVTAAAEYYFRFAWRSAAFATTTLVAFLKGSTQIGALMFNNSTGRFDYRVGTSGTAASGTFVFSLNTWYLIECHLKIDDSPNGVFQLKIEGNTPLDIDFAGDTKPGADTTMDNITFTRLSTNDWFDDLACNNAAGGWCGDGHIIYMPAAADVGGAIQLTGQDGNQVDNYDNVNNIPYSAATYNESAVADERDLYTLGTGYDGTGRLIKAIWVEARAEDTVSAGGKCALGIKTADVGATERYCSDISLVTSYTRIVGDRHDVNPEDSGTWEEADIDGIAVGFKVR